MENEKITIPSTEKNEVLKVLAERRSIRAYTNEQIADKDLESILEAGTWAPTGHGTQEPWIVAVQNPETLATLRRLNAEAMGKPDIDPYYGAPTIILVFADKSCPNAVKDGSLVLGNMMNAAASLGISSCWINREDVMFETEEGKELLKSFGLGDEDIFGVGALSIGYAATRPHNVKPRKEGYYRIIR